MVNVNFFYNTCYSPHYNRHWLLVRKIRDTEEDDKTENLALGK